LGITLKRRMWGEEEYIDDDAKEGRREIVERVEEGRQRLRKGVNVTTSDSSEGAGPPD